MLRLESLCAGYRGLQILHEVDLEVNEGEIVALVGANGAGQDHHPAGLLRGDHDRPTGHDPLRRPADRRRAGPPSSWVAGWCTSPRTGRCSGRSPSRRTCGWGPGPGAAAPVTESLVRGLRPLPHPRGPPPADRRDPQRRPAADADHRPRPHGPAAPAHARRAVHRAVPEADVGGPRGDRGHPRPRRGRAARRAERRPGAADVRPRLRHGERQPSSSPDRVPSSPRTTGSAPHTWGCRPMSQTEVARGRRAGPGGVGVRGAVGRRSTTRSASA